MKILLVAEKEGTAIHRLCKMTAASAPWHQFRIVCVHPKRPNATQLAQFESGLAWCDLIDFRYWRTAELLHTMYDISKPGILTHYNPYDLHRSDWMNYKLNIVVNSEQVKILKQVCSLIPLPIDLDFWQYTPDDKYRSYGPDRVIMVANRIEGKKGVLEVAQACHELGIEFRLVGNISDQEYFDRVVAAGGEQMQFFHNVSDEELRAIYRMSTIHVCNSVDGYESGTMPILEAMACGIPVLTRNVGHVPDLYDGRNMLVRSGQPADVAELKQCLNEMLKDEKRLIEMRRSGYSALRRRTLDIYGLQYSKIYHRIHSPKEDLVSVVMPISDGPERWMKSVAAVFASEYKNIELILCDDSEGIKVLLNKETIDQFRKNSGMTIKYRYTAMYRPKYIKTEGAEGFVKTYGLARARNAGIMEAEGKYVCFIDDQIVVDPGTITAFVARMKPNVWLWGVKNGSKKGFVENLSMTNREDIIRIGGFCEQITQYGGMTQEVRKRAELNGIQFELVETATGHRDGKSRSRWTRQRDIATSKAQCYKLYG